VSDGYFPRRCFLNEKDLREDTLPTVRNFVRVRSITAEWTPPRMIIVHENSMRFISRPPLIAR